MLIGVRNSLAIQAVNNIPRLFSGSSTKLSRDEALKNWLHLIKHLRWLENVLSNPYKLSLIFCLVLTSLIVFVCKHFQGWLSFYCECFVSCTCSFSIQSILWCSPQPLRRRFGVSIVISFQSALVFPWCKWTILIFGYCCKEIFAHHFDPKMKYCKK